MAAGFVDVQPIKPIPGVQPSRKVEHDQRGKKSPTLPDNDGRDKQENDSPGVDTYA